MTMSRAVEKGGDLGGVWDPARSYPGVQTQTPRDLYCFSDLPDAGRSTRNGRAGRRCTPTSAPTRGISASRPCIRFQTEVLSLSRQPGAAGLAGHAARRRWGYVDTERFDLVVVASGQFSRPRTLHLPGEDAFVAAGGVVRHSSAVRGRRARPGVARPGRGRVRQIGDRRRDGRFGRRRAHGLGDLPPGAAGRSPTSSAARSTSSTSSTAAPRRRCSCLGRRAAPGASRGRLLAPAIWANWRALEALLRLQFGLRRAGLHPEGPDRGQHPLRHQHRDAGLLQGRPRRDASVR